MQTTNNSSPHGEFPLPHRSLKPEWITGLLLGVGLPCYWWSSSAGNQSSYAAAVALWLGLLMTVAGGWRLARAKGYSGWLGLLGLLGVMGGVLLLLLPGRGAGKPTLFQRTFPLAVALFAVVLCRDAAFAREHRWLPSVCESMMPFGPVLLVVTAAAYLLRMRNDAADNPRTARLAQGLLWLARGLGLFLLAAPLLVAAHVSLTRPPGVRPGNEGEGLGLFIVFILCWPAGLGLTLFAFLPKPKPPVRPADGA